MFSAIASHMDLTMWYCRSCTASIREFCPWPAQPQEPKFERSTFPSARRFSAVARSAAARAVCSILPLSASLDLISLDARDTWCSVWWVSCLCSLTCSCGIRTSAMVASAKLREHLQFRITLATASSGGVPQKVGSSCTVHAPDVTGVAEGRLAKEPLDESAARSTPVSSSCTRSRSDEVVLPGSTLCRHVGQAGCTVVLSQSCAQAECKRWQQGKK